MPAFAKEKFRRNDFAHEVLNSYGRRNMDSLLRIFPQKRRAFWQKTADNGEKICEIRLRVDRPVIVETSRGDYFLNNGGEWQEHPYGAHLVTEAEIRELIAWLCQDSVYAYADEIRQGFLTVEGGHRIGLCGQAVLENETVIRTLKNISFINIRVAHEIRGAADGILPKLYKKGKFQNTLIVSPPGFGKTTLLRDLIRQISDGNTYGAGLRVGVVDERSELREAIWEDLRMIWGCGRMCLMAVPRLRGCYYFCVPCHLKSLQWMNWGRKRTGGPYKKQRPAAAVCWPLCMERTRRTQQSAWVNPACDRYLTA